MLKTFSSLCGISFKGGSHAVAASGAVIHSSVAQSTLDRRACNSSLVCDTSIDKAGLNGVGHRKRSLIERINRRMVVNAVRAVTKYMRDAQPYKAMRALQVLRRFAPAEPAVLILLAKCSWSASEPYITRDAIRALLALPLRNPYWVCRAANFECNVGEIEGVRETLAMAKDRFPTSWLVWRALGFCQAERSEIVAALGSFRKAIELAPTEHARIDALYRLADCLDETGQREDAILVYREIGGLAPDDALIQSRLVDCEDGADTMQKYAESLLAVLRTHSATRSQRRHLHYALGQIYDKTDRPVEAFAHLHVANELRRAAGPSWNLSRLQAEVEGRVEVFNRDLIARLAPHGCLDDALIFVVGMPRSGTTLIEQILSSHSAVRGLGERPDIWCATRALRWEIKCKKEYPWCAKELSSSFVQKLSQSLAERRRQTAGWCRRHVSKLPEDFWDLGLISILFPNARIIHCRRHPIDTCLSCYMQNFANVTYATSLTDLEGVYRLYQRIMGHWRDVLPASSIFDVQYEEIVNRPEEIVRSLCSFCGLPFEEGCLQFYENRRRVDTVSRWQVRRPVYTNSVGRWKRYREFLGPLLALDESINSCGGGAEENSECQSAQMAIGQAVRVS
jgi:tetratricopeptide (TPR) repeat protein